MIFKSYNVDNQKAAAFYGDNCNTNFRMINRRGTKNVYSNLKEDLSVNIKGIGSSVHIVHNTIQYAVDGLPVKIDFIVVKIYKYFCIYTIYITNLKEFSETVGIEYKKLVKYGNTRFLSLLPAVQKPKILFSCSSKLPAYIATILRNRNWSTLLLVCIWIVKYIQQDH